MKKALFGLILTVFSFGLLGGCNPEGESSSTEHELLFGFENYEQIQSFKIWGDKFGRAEVNTNDEFITEGNGSLHVLPDGNYDSINGYPYFLMNVASEHFTTLDFSDYSGIVMDVYNDSEEDTSIHVRLGAIGDTGSIEDTAMVRYELPAKEWTKVVYDFSDGSIKYNLNNLEIVDEIYVQFDDYRAYKQDDICSIYFDNLCGIKGETKQYSKTVKDGKLLDFEEKSDINLFNFRTFTFSRSFDPVVSLNTNKNFVSSGEKSMKCVVEYKENSHIFINSPNPDRAITLYTKTFPNAFDGKTTVSFDVMNASKFATTIKFFYDFNSTKYTVTISLQPYEWTNVTTEIGDLSKTTQFGVIFTPSVKENETYYLDNFVVS